jgi:hypothetical protein
MSNANNAASGLKLQLSPQELEFQLNQGGSNTGPQIQFGSQLVRRSVKILKAVYDFAVQGGAVGNINLYDATFAPGISAPPGQGQIAGTTTKGIFKPCILPPNAIVTRVLIDVLTNPTSGGSATLALSTGQTAADLLAATAKASFTGLIDGIPVNTAATAVKILSSGIPAGVQGCIPYLAVATAALTAGKFNVHMEYYLSD